MWQRGILSALEKYPAVHLMDLLPKPRTRSQVAALNRAARQLEAAGKIQTMRWAGSDRYCIDENAERLMWGGSGGFITVARPGYPVRGRGDVPRISVASVPQENPCNT